jgi:alditol oxidase
VEQRVYRDMPWEVLVDHLEQVLTSAYSVSAFTTWRGTAEVWVKRRTGDPPADLSWTGAREASEPRHPVPGQPAEYTTQQLGVPGRWHERLPHFRAEFTPSVGAELQSELFVGAADAPAALRALAEVREHITPALLTCELRTIDADEQWLSPTYGRASVAFHFTWRQDAPAVTGALRHMERALAPWAARPHWAKLFVAPAEELRSRYERWSDFAALLAELDPAGKFRNDVIDGWFPRAR